MEVSFDRPLTEWLIPDPQRKGSTELAEQLDLGSGDRPSKRSAFWVMLVLAAAIATAGVLSNSTATVIGAMIIAPLATPIMAMALGISGGGLQILRRGFLYVLGGMGVVIAIGLVGSLVLAPGFNLLTNPQISSRTSPTLLDLAAAVATGFAGAVGVARRDVSDVLPGVAVAISLVPPLAVVGICLGQGAFALALGALILFASNVVSMIIAGTVIFAVAYRHETATDQTTGQRRSRVVVWVVLGLVLIPLVVNTAALVLVNTWTNRVTSTAKAWLANDPDSRLINVQFASRDAVISVATPNELPPTSQLLTMLQGQVPSGVEVTVNVVAGKSLDAGTVP